MIDMAKDLAAALDEHGITTFKGSTGIATQSHQFAVLAAPYGGGQTAS